MKLSVYNLQGKESANIDLPEDLFKSKINKNVIYQAVIMYRAALRQGTASTKTMGEVSGGGKKPWRQKGTGRARVGSIRSPLWSGGGVVFGPHPRDFRYSIPRKIKRAALRESLNAKYQNKNLICLMDLKEPFKKTKEFSNILSALKLEGRTLALLDGSDPSIQRVSRNIPFFQLMRSQDVTVYDVLSNKNLLVSKTSLTNLINRLKDSVEEVRKSSEGKAVEEKTIKQVKK